MSLAELTVSSDEDLLDQLRVVENDDTRAPEPKNDDPAVLTRAVHQVAKRISPMGDQEVAERALSPHGLFRITHVRAITQILSTFTLDPSVARSPGSSMRLAFPVQAKLVPFVRTRPRSDDMARERHLSSCHAAGHRIDRRAVGFG
jgi:hypothetical protein